MTYDIHLKITEINVLKEAWKISSYVTDGEKLPFITGSWDVVRRKDHKDAWESRKDDKDAWELRLIYYNQKKSYCKSTRTS